MLLNIKQILNIGTIYEYKNKSDVRLAVNDSSSLLYLIKNIIEKYPLITKHQLKRYLLLRECFLNKVKLFKTIEDYNVFITQTKTTIENKVEKISDLEITIQNQKIVDHWIIGFINGEGSFYLKNKKCSFFIEHTDKYSLEMIKQRFNFGPNVLERSLRKRDEGKIRKNTYVLHISSKKDIETLINFLDDNSNICLQGYKFILYNEWKTQWTN